MNPPNNPPLFLAEKVRKNFGGVQALNSVTLSVRERTITLLIGPNGSGKTTLLNIASGTLKPDAGRLFFAGRDITRLPPHERFKLGIARTFQIPSLFTSLSVLENLLVPGDFELPPAILLTRAWERRQRKRVEKAFHVLKLLSLDHLWDSPASELSGGQMKLLELARALMSDPKLLLLDEPLAGVNPVLAEGVMNHLVKLRRELKISFLVVEHRLDVALRYADYVYALHKGRVVSEGPPDVVVKSPAVAEPYLGG